MSKKFSVYNYFEKMITEAGEMAPPGGPAMPPPGAPQTPEQTGQQQKAKGPEQSEPFRELMGQTITAVSFAPNGPNGGIISIKTKNSHLPFKISWVNSKATAQDTSGNVVSLSE